MKKLLLILAVLLPLTAFAAEAPSPEARLAQIQQARQSLQKDFNIGQLMMQNAQLQAQQLDQQEAAVRAEIEAAKKKEPAKK